MIKAEAEEESDIEPGRVTRENSVAAVWAAAVESAMTDEEEFRNAKADSLMVERAEASALEAYRDDKDAAKFAAKRC